MEINWTVLTYFVIGLFALNGFFRGWWKEAIVTIFLALFIFFLQQPGIAQQFIEFLNNILITIWDLLPDSFVSFLQDVLERGLGVRTAANGAIQADPGDANTWLMILLLVIVAAVLIGRALLPRDFTKLPAHVYIPTTAGSILGGLVGILNGFIVINLIREYLDGRNLPGSQAPATEITMAGEGGFRAASSGVSLQAVELPRFTILDSFIPWIIIALGLLIFIAAISSWLSRDGLNVRTGKKVPFGYRPGDIVSRPPTPPR